MVSLYLSRYLLKLRETKLMKAMILAAGLGTRLRPLTDYQPKALVEIKEIPLLEIAIRRLKLFGFDDIIINVHHFAELITCFLKKKNNFGINITISDESDQILETGGGLKKAAHFFDDQPFLLYNTDVLCDVDLLELYKTHLRSEALATLLVRQRETTRYFIFDESDDLQGWMNIKTGEIKIPGIRQNTFQMLAFSGVHVISPEIFNLMEFKSGSFSIIDVYLDAIPSHKIKGFQHNEGIWLDAGKTENLERAAQIVDQIPLAD